MLLELFEINKPKAKRIEFSVCGGDFLLMLMKVPSGSPV